MFSAYTFQTEHLTYFNVKYEVTWGSWQFAAQNALDLFWLEGGTTDRLFDR